MTDSNARILQTPLSTDIRGSSVRVVVAADKYTVARISEGVNDRAEYARLFAAAPALLSTMDRAIELLGDWLTDNTETVFEEQPEIDDIRSELIEAVASARAASCR
jgi:hypothetical protein